MMLDFTGAGGRGRRGIALLATLAILTLITVMVVSFVTITGADRAATGNYTQALKADEIARAGLDDIVGRLKAEIVDPVKSTTLSNSTVPASANYLVYRPLAATNAVPERMANLPTGDTNLFNIVKISLPGKPFYTTTAATGTNFASSALTTTKSLNGRAMNIARWDFPQLVPPASTNNFPIPNWVLLGRNGPLLPTGDLSGSIANPNAVLGRYAYVVYDVSGLIDATVAGCPASVAATNKGLLPLADLTQLAPGVLKQSDVENLVKWRNAANYANYTAYLTNWPTNGFMQVANGDTTFLGRQELIKFASQPGNTNWAAALPYLTTFSRELNGPVWGPSADAPAGQPFDYRTHQYSPTTATKTVPNSIGAFGSATVYNNNVFILNPRVVNQYTNNFGIVRNPGEPLVMYRFPLNKLALLESTTDSVSWSSNRADIQKYFGLDYVTTGSDAEGNSQASIGNFHHWSYPTTNNVYKYGVTSRILTLDEIAALSPGRDPNFFELLQAGILSGSLAKDGRGDYSTTPPSYNAAVPDPDASIPNQIVRIGANIIDQWSAENCPTTITFNGSDFYGIKDLPYPTKFFEKIYTDPVTAATAAGSVQVCFYFEMWNPHQNLGNASVQPLNLRWQPTTTDNYRIKFNQGTASVYYWGTNSLTLGRSDATNYFSALPSGGIITFANAAGAYREPSLIYNGAPAILTTYVINQNPIYPGSAYPPQDRNVAIDGVTLPNITLPPVNQTNSGTNVWQAGHVWSVAPNNSLVYLLQYEWPTGSQHWHTYSTFAGQENPSGRWAQTMGSLAPVQTTATPNTGVYVKGDPRTPRWAASFSNTNTAGPLIAGESLFPIPGGTANIYQGIDQSLPFPVATANSAYRMDAWAGNTSSVSATPIPYADKDGVQRLGDAAFSYGKSHSPFFPGDSSRPIVLNRPFTSVGDLGFVFRDVAWKTLNFFSGDSADAALLDLFTLSDGPVVAGHVNPNTAPVPVLQALLSGASLGPVADTSPLTSSAAQVAAQDFWGIATNHPFASRADIVPNFMAANTPAAADGISSASHLKTESEALVRSVVESANTRTWNLMIDIVAQSGQYPAGTTVPDKFVVAGERRYWLHIAIDRYTGQIIDRQLEPVSE